MHRIFMKLRIPDERRPPPRGCRDQVPRRPLTNPSSASPDRGFGIATRHGPRYRCVMATDALRSPRDERSFLLQRVQPAMTGLIDGSLSTLAPILSVAIATHRPHYAFFAGLAAAIGAGVSMAFSEGLSDTGDLTGRGNPYLRGSITGIGTFLGGILHTLPFLISDYRIALAVAVIVIAFELMSLALIRWRFFHTGFLRSFASIALGGAIIAVISAALGGAAG
jgi:erythrin-vacuolar iron transport family protein